MGRRGTRCCFLRRHFNFCRPFPQRFADLLRRLSRSPQDSFPPIVVSLFVSGVLRGAAHVSAADILDAGFDAGSAGDDAAGRGKYCGATLTLKLEMTEEEDEDERDVVALVGLQTISTN